MHKTNCMQSIEQISTWEVFSSICPLNGPYNQDATVSSVHRGTL